MKLLLMSSLFLCCLCSNNTPKNNSESFEEENKYLRISTGPEGAMIEIDGVVVGFAINLVVPITMDAVSIILGHDSLSITALPIYDPSLRKLLSDIPRGKWTSEKIRWFLEYRGKQYVQRKIVKINSAFTQNKDTLEIYFNMHIKSMPFFEELDVK